MRRFLGLLCCLFPLSLQAQTLLGPSVYTSFTNSPFNGGSFTYFHLETYEDSLFNVPGVTASGGAVVVPGGNTDSVDADDGVIDGRGQDGHSYFLNSGNTGIRFTFSALALGQLPTHAGIVWTDGNNQIRFEAFNGAGTSLGFLTGIHADSSNAGFTAEDRFYGITSPGGIGSILIQSGLPGSGGGIEVDHLQYGFSTAVPEPGVFLLASSMTVVGVIAHYVRQRKRRARAKPVEMQEEEVA
jgi:hypothetical protein